MSSNTHYSNVLNENLSLTGSKSYIIDDAHFTEQDCNITADGTLNICCPIKFKEILCIDGQLGCNQLVVRTGATGGITFSNDSCDGAVTTLPRLFEDAANLNLSAPSLKNLNVNTPAAMNKEICFISRPGDGLSYCCFQSEPNPKPMPGMERNGKIIVAGVGKQRFDV